MLFLTSSFSAASTQRSDAGPAPEGTLQHPAPPAPAFPAEGHADETEHTGCFIWSRGPHWSRPGPERLHHDTSTAAAAAAATAVQLPTRVQPNNREPPYLTKSFQPHRWGPPGQQAVQQSPREQPVADGWRAGPVQQHRQLLNPAGLVPAVCRFR